MLLLVAHDETLAFAFFFCLPDKPADMWYVLEAPEGTDLEVAKSPAARPKIDQTTSVSTPERGSQRDESEAKVNKRELRGMGGAGGGILHA